MKQKLIVLLALIAVVATAEFVIVPKLQTVTGVRTERMILSFYPRASCIVSTRNASVDGSNTVYSAPLQTVLNETQTLAMGDLTPKLLGGDEDMKLIDQIGKAIELGLLQNGYTVTNGTLLPR